MKLKRLIYIVLAVTLSVLLTAADVTPQQKYIDTYAAVAVREMYRSGVPASITLAQGILESGSGRSRLATEGNNHFGIKCHDWKGKSMRADDDAKNECFRVYDDAEQSFMDHSDFLRYRDRYKFLFEYEITDYKSWAYGLKKAGYATAPTYAESLIRLIEDYGLSKYDTMSTDAAVQEAEAKPEQTEAAPKAKRQKKAKKPSKKAAVPEEIPQSPLTIEEAKPITKEVAEKYTFALSRRLLAKNGVPFLYSVEGETYSSIAQNNHLFLKEILMYNDLAAEVPLLPGTVVYLQPKKKQAPKDLAKYVVEEDGEQLRDICQRFAVRMKNIQKINSFQSGHVLKAGDTVLLRK